MTKTPLLGRDIWVRHVLKDGKSYVQFHRVWDADLFLRTQGEEAAKTGGRVELAAPPP